MFINAELRAAEEAWLLLSKLVKDMSCDQTYAPIPKLCPYLFEMQVIAKQLVGLGEASFFIRRVCVGGGGGGGGRGCFFLLCLKTLSYLPWKSVYHGKISSSVASREKPIQRYKVYKMHALLTCNFCSFLISKHSIFLGLGHNQ